MYHFKFFHLHSDLEPFHDFLLGGGIGAPVFPLDEHDGHAVVFEGLWVELFHFGDGEPFDVGVLHIDLLGDLAGEGLRIAGGTQLALKLADEGVLLVDAQVLLVDDVLDDLVLLGDVNGLASLLDNQFGVCEAILVLQRVLQFSDLAFRQGPSHQRQGDALFFGVVVADGVDNLDVLETFALLGVVHKFDGLGVESGLTHHVDGQYDTGYQYDDGEYGDDALDGAVTSGFHILYLGEREESDHHEGGEGDEEGVEEEEVEGPEEILELGGGEAVAGCAERRHQGGGDGHARDDGDGLRLAGCGHDAGQTAEKGDEHVEDSGPSACQQFRLRVAERRDQEVQERGQQTDQHHNAEVLDGLLQQVFIHYAHGETDAVDGSHQGRNQHCADDDGGGVDVQSHRSHDDGKHQNPHIHPAELHAFGYGVNGGLVVGVLAQLGEVLDIAPHKPELCFEWG